MQGRFFPKISFVIPTLNSETKLPICLESIRTQQYPSDFVEIVVVDGGSTDRTVALAQQYGAKVIPNPARYQEPGKTLGFNASTGDYVFFVDSDNELAQATWAGDMVLPFVDNKTVECVFASCGFGKHMSNVNRYIAAFADPFSFFVFRGANVTVRTETTFRNYYRVISETKKYLVFEMNIKYFPVLALTQGTGLKRSFIRKKECQNDDILPCLNIIESGGRFAFVKSAMTFHHSADTTSQYLLKLQWRIRNNVHGKFEDSGILARDRFISPARRIRMYAFVPYALSIVGPFVDSILQFAHIQDFSIFLHPYLSFRLALTILIEYLKKLAGIRSGIGDYGQ